MARVDGNRYLIGGFFHTGKLIEIGKAVEKIALEILTLADWWWKKLTAF